MTSSGGRPRGSAQDPRTKEAAAGVRRCRSSSRSPPTPLPIPELVPAPTLSRIEHVTRVHAHVNRINMNVEKPRYSVGRRGEAVERTRRAIIDEAVRAFGTKPFDLVSLREIAAGSDVTQQTVLRIHASKESLFVTAVAAARGRILASRRDAAASGDPSTAVRRLAAVYEEWGDATLILLGQELRVPLVRRFTDEGRAYHRTWVRRVFKVEVARRTTSRRRCLVAQLAAATDVTAWKVLRRDFELSREETAAALTATALAVARDS
jgi:AcrR family transcriptional regulator